MHVYKYRLVRTAEDDYGSYNIEQTGIVLADDKVSAKSKIINSYNLTGNNNNYRIELGQEDVIEL